MPQTRPEVPSAAALFGGGQTSTTECPRFAFSGIVASLGCARHRKLTNAERPSRWPSTCGLAGEALGNHRVLIFMAKLYSKSWSTCPSFDDGALCNTHCGANGLMERSMAFGIGKTEPGNTFSGKGGRCRRSMVLFGSLARAIGAFLCSCSAASKRFAGNSLMDRRLYEARLHTKCDAVLRGYGDRCRALEAGRPATAVLHGRLQACGRGRAVSQTLEN